MIRIKNKLALENKTPVEVYNLDDECIGVIYSEAQLLDLQCQIVEHGGVEGYYIKYAGNISKIDKWGNVDPYPDLWDTPCELYQRLVNARVKLEERTKEF